MISTLNPLQAALLQQGLAGPAISPFGAGGYPGAAAPFGGEATPQGILLPQNTLDPETQALNDFLQSATSGLIKKLYDYLNANTEQWPQLADSVPLVQRAAELFGARDYPRAFAQAFQAFRSISLVRARQPNVPGL
jgi:hypothetical protein